MPDKISPPPPPKKKKETDFSASNFLKRSKSESGQRGK